MSISGLNLILAQEATPGGGTYTTIAGGRVHSISINNQTVDTTTKDDAGIRQLLAAKVLQSYSCSIDGLAKDSATLKALRDAAIASTPLNFRMTTGGDSTAGVTYTGPFIVTSFEERSNHDGAQEFAATFESSGTITAAALT